MLQMPGLQLSGAGYSPQGTFGCLPLVAVGVSRHCLLLNNHDQRFLGL